MMTDNAKTANFESMILHQWAGQMPPHAGLLEQRVLELEGMGLLDIEEMPGIPSSARQFAIASLQHTKPAYFITYDDTMLSRRDELESRYGLSILSVQEALLLFRDNDAPPN